MFLFIIVPQQFGIESCLLLYDNPIQRNFVLCLTRSICV